MGDMTQMRKPQRGLTFEDVWAAMMETEKRFKETDRKMQETDRRIKEMTEKSDREWEEIHRQTQETDRLIKENAQRQAETDRQMKETDRQIKKNDKKFGEFTNRFGEMVEYMIVPNLVTKFRELGFEFEKTHRDTVIASKEHNIFTEVDAFLENGDKVMIVEIKNKPTIDDIKYHVTRMKKLRAHADLHHDKRAYLGAMAGVVFNDRAKTYALKSGFYVIEPSGDTFSITKPEGEYQVKEW